VHDRARALVAHILGVLDVDDFMVLERAPDGGGSPPPAPA
jgi:hypothetical protein